MQRVKVPLAIELCPTGVLQESKKRGADKVALRQQHNILVFTSQDAMINVSSL